MKRLLYPMLMLSFGLFVTSSYAQSCSPAQKAACAKICGDQKAEACVAKVATVKTVSTSDMQSVSAAAQRCDVSECSAICKLICGSICANKAASAGDVQGTETGTVKVATMKQSCNSKEGDAEVVKAKLAGT